MPSIQSDDVNCTHPLNDLCDGFEHFSQNKEEQLRQLKPFADKDSAYLTNLIRKAWDSFSANDKAIYHEEANVTTADLEEWIIEEEESDFGVDEDNSPNLELAENSDNPLSEKKEPFHFCLDNVAYPSIIYIGELNRIIVQDDYFSSNQKGIARMLLHIGWTQLRQEQREEYAEKSKKKWICFKKGSTYQHIAKAEFDEFVKALDNKEDFIALEALREDACPHRDSLFNWHHRMHELFFVLTPSQRDEYYDMGYRHRTSKIAWKLFAKDKLLEDHAEGSYCFECEFDKLNDPEKKKYLEKATKIVQNYRQNLRKGIEDTASIDDYDAVPCHLCWGSELDERAFEVYLLKMRPVLWKTPKLENKRYFELNLILKQRWATLTLEEKQPYYETEKGGVIVYSNLSAEEKIKFNEKALLARKQLLKDYPDLKEYFGWMHANKPNHNRWHVDTKCDVTLKEYSGKPFIVKQKITSDWFAGADYKELKAYETFEGEVCTHFKGGLNSDAEWKKWMELTDAEQAQYYKKYLKITHNTVAMSQYFHKVDPAYDETNMTCNYCGFDRLDKAEKKDYMKKSKRRVIRIIKRELKERQKRLAEKELEDKSADHPKPQPDSDTTHFYIEDVDAYYSSKLTVHSRESLEFNAFYPYFKKHIKSFSKDPENQHLPYSRICEKVEQSFWDLPDEERKSYFNAVIRYVELEKQMDPLRGGYSYFVHENKNTTLRFYGMSEGERPFYEKGMMQARVKLLRDNPDLSDYFYFEKRCNSPSQKSYYSEDSEDKNCQEKRIPTAFMCYVHAVRPLMKQQDPIFRKKFVDQQKWILGMKWSEFNEEQKAVYYEKQQRVEDRVNVKQFFEQFYDLTFDDDELKMSP
uniref:HMG box domain-containing protein n=1 Tax=Panagrellus redivivus TaxID=6233 RepID=A0A7E4VGS7_PANRE